MSQHMHDHIMLTFISQNLFFSKYQLKLDINALNKYQETQMCRFHTY